jgi:hypothetical protein
MKGRWFAKAWLGCLLPLVAAAAVVERDLGQGLAYFRVRELPGDLPGNPAGAAPACVVDVRFVAAGRDAAAAFAAWLKFRATPRSPVLVLANRETSPELRQALHEPHRGTGVAVIGIAGLGFTPDVSVRSTPEKEKAAYEAFDRGAALAALLTDNPDKVRNDEARLARNSAAIEGEGTPSGGKPAPVEVDATLQRAVHLHRALLALRRNPAAAAK